ncbi:MAG: phosphate ABC transporter, permease protein PstA, partial [Methanothrix sp.]|nr:phosphate ABC transporter, permease protein PstA [Methanothrix sp.]
MPTIIGSFAISVLLFITSISCTLLQPDIEKITPFWQAGLIIDILLIIASYLCSLSRMDLRRTGPFLALDVIICSCILFLMHSGVLHPGFIISRPLGVGASFDYSFILSLLFLIASMLLIKDALNIVYGY